MGRKSIQLLYYISSFLKRIFSIRFYLNLMKWKKLHNKYKGKRVFLIGNGPSLNQTPIYLLKNEYTITFNHFNLLLERLNWNPEFYMLVDATVAQDSRQEIEKMVELSNYSFFPDYHRIAHIDFSKFIPNNDKVHYMIPFPLNFSKHLPLVGSGGTVIVEGFQVLAHLGFSEIYILGVDMNYIIHTNTKVINNGIQSNADDDPNHFDNRYFGKGRKYHQPTQQVINNIFKGLLNVKIGLDRLNIKSLNIGYNSKVDYFEKNDFIGALGYNKHEIDTLFEDLIKTKGYSSLAKFLSETRYITDAYEWDNNIKLQSIETTKAQSIIKEKILTHLPLGPYNNNIYFINRDFL